MFCLCLHVWLFVCLAVVFFFKQKTAYEMRISDWSSDVCSSDLLDRLLALGVPGRAIAELGSRQIPFGVGHVERIERGLYQPGEGPLHVLSPVYADGEEIGRASCRERVCQYV